MAARDGWCRIGLVAGGGSIAGQVKFFIRHRFAFSRWIVTSTGASAGGRLLVLAVQMVSLSRPGPVWLMRASGSVTKETTEPSSSARKMSRSIRDPLYTQDPLRIGDWVARLKTSSSARRRVSFPFVLHFTS